MDIRNDCLKAYQDKGAFSLEDAMSQVCTDTWGSKYLQDVPGCLYAWGQNSDGQVGDGTNLRRSSPVQIPSTQWVRIAGGDFHAAAIKADSTLWTWGKNNHGQLGDNSSTPRCSPVQVPGCWKGVAAGGYHTLGVKTDGTLWIWGHNNYGQLGNQDPLKDDKSSPIQVGTACDWSCVTAGHQSSYALKVCNGQMWAWGINCYGQLGTNNVVHRSSPVQISGNNWYAFDSGGEHILATKRDGTLWSWGSNTFGQLGACRDSGLTTHRSSPVQIMGYNWVDISAGREHSMAINNECDAYGWGSNRLGQLGTGNCNCHRSSPTIIPGTRRWVSIAAGANHTVLKDCDNRIWSMGNNADGQGGRNCITPRSSPVIIGALTCWTEISAFGDSTYAITCC